jgi:hypothetical protein
MLFQAFPKLSRLSRQCVVTEKIDGTNAQIFIVEPETLECEQYEAVMDNVENAVASIDHLLVFAGSRTRIITPGKNTDNFGFAAWVQDNADELVKLGVGRHFGEWWGKGIQRGYGLAEKRFSLFHTHGIEGLPSCVSVVPTLLTGSFDAAFLTPEGPKSIAELALERLKQSGSIAAPGFMNPEGIVVFHEHARVAFKKTFDDRHKEVA